MGRWHAGRPGADDAGTVRFLDSSTARCPSEWTAAPVSLTWLPAGQTFPFMSRAEPSRRSFLRGALFAATGLIGSGTLLEQGRLVADWAGDPDPEPPNEEVARILREISAGKPIRRGHVSLDMPVAAEDGRIVPVIIESDLPMSPERYVKSIHLVVDHNPDAHLAAFHLTPAVGSVSISTRIKMKRTTWVRALARTSDDEIWAAYARVQVTLNGCG